MKKLSKAEVMESIEREHGNLLHTLNEISPKEMVKPGVLTLPEPGQSCKDVMAHLTAWEQRMLNLIRAILSDEPRPKYPTAPKFNKQVFEINKDLPLSQVQKEFDDSFHEVFGFVNGLIEEELAIDGVWQLVGYNTYNHYKWGRRMIRRWQRAKAKKTN